MDAFATPAQLFTASSDEPARKRAFDGLKAVEACLPPSLVRLSGVQADSGASVLLPHTAEDVLGLTVSSLAWFSLTV